MRLWGPQGAATPAPLPGSRLDCQHYGAPAAEMTGSGVRDGSDRPCCPCSQAAVQRAEAVASAASQHATGAHAEGLQLLQPVLQAVRHQHEVERTAEALQKAVLGSKALADLPRLEAAILAARKAGDIDADILRYQLHLDQHNRTLQTSSAEAAQNRIGYVCPHIHRLCWVTCSAETCPLAFSTCHRLA